jgi:hypothetical protein
VLSIGAWNLHLDERRRASGRRRAGPLLSPVEITQSRQSRRRAASVRSVLRCRDVHIFPGRGCGARRLIILSKFIRWEALQVAISISPCLHRLKLRTAADGGTAARMEFPLLPSSRPAMQKQSSTARRQPASPPAS